MGFMSEENSALKHSYSVCFITLKKLALMRNYVQIVLGAWNRVIRFALWKSRQRREQHQA